MLNPTQIFIPSSRFAQLANVELHVIQMRTHRGNGICMGVQGRKLENGRWVFPSADVYKALGLFPDSKLPAAQGLQDRAIVATGADVLAAHLITGWLHQTSRQAATPRQAVDELLSDVRDQIALSKACRARVGFALNHEDSMSSDDWATAHALAAALESELEALTGYLRWRAPTATKTATTGGAR